MKGPRDFIKMEGAKILVVEDEFIVARDIQSMLESLGYCSALAVSAEEAVRKAGELRPDLILMDIVLKGHADGITAADRIRTELDIPVIYLTAYADETTLHRAKLTEPSGYIVKPFDEREIQIAIELALYRHRKAKKAKRGAAQAMQSGTA